MYSCTRKQATQLTCPSSRAWWKQATEDLANEEAKRGMYTVVLEKQATKQQPVFKSFGGSKPLRIWQTKKPSGACSPGGMHAYMDRVFMQCFLNPSDVHSCTENRPRSNLPVFKSFGGSKPLRTANEEAKWVKLKDKKLYRIRKGN
ncbi:hypothetical protein TNCV_3694981 [Trichonephila clavipes]|nr:hypothetical protein TNCV_3694981 [Trichonephila clavipes]